MMKQPSRNAPNAKELADDPLAYLNDTPISCVSPPVVTRPQVLPFHELSWENFERLCLRLVHTQPEIDHVQPYGIQGQNQQGIDIYARVKGNVKYWVYQCKRERNFGKRKIEAAVKRFLCGTRVSETERFFLCTTDSLRRTERVDELERQNRILAQRGITLVSLDADSLSVMLKDKPALVRDFFGPGWVQAFCGLEPKDLPQKDIDIVATEKKVRDAATQALGNWKSQYGFVVQQLIELNLRFEQQKEHDGGIHSDKRKLASLTEFVNYISGIRHVVIKGEPGAGKTFMLLQIADKILAAQGERIPIFVSLKEWAAKDGDFFDFVAKQLSSIRGDVISAYDLMVLNARGRLIILLNGWNEVPVESINSFTQQLNPIIRNSADTSFIITSRESEYEAPFSKPVIVHIVPLNRNQRNEIIHKNVFSNAHTLITRIEADPKLAEITQTPLYLAALIRIFAAHGIIPNSRYQIIQQLIDDSVREHQSELLKAPSAGYHDCYLKGLAYSYQSANVTGSTESVTVDYIGNQSNELVNRGYLESVPNAKNVLSALYSSHVLIRTSEPNGVIQFPHHQVQEWYASKKLYDLIRNNSRSDADRKWHFQSEVINKPFCEQSLLFLIGRLAMDSHEKKGKDALLELIQWTIPIDLYFACRMVATAGDVFQKEFPNTLEDVLRSMWKSSHQHICDYALSCMLATQSPIFADIFIPLIGNNDEQVRLKTYRLVESFPASCLGQDWWKVYSGWSADRRAEFVHAVGLHSYTMNSKVIDYIADNDTTSEVRIALCQVYERNVIDDKLHRLLGKLNWSHVLRSELIHWLPRQIVVKHVYRLRKALLAESDQSLKIAGLIHLAEIGDDQSIEILKKEVEGRVECEDYRMLKAFSLCHSKYPDWVLRCLVARLCEGRLWNELYSRMNDERSDWNSVSVKTWLSGADQDAWLQIFISVLSETRELRKRIEVLVAVNPDFIAAQILKAKMNSTTKNNETHKQLQYCAQCLPISSKVKAVLGWVAQVKSPTTYDIIRTLTEYLVSVESNSRFKSDSIDPDLRNRMREKITEWGNLDLPNNDHGRLRSELATLLGRIGTSDDLSVLKDWITKEQQRDEEEYKTYVINREEWLRNGKHSHPIPFYTKYLWQSQYVDAIKRLPSKRSIDLLRQLLNDSECVEAASRSLVKLARPDSDVRQNIYGLWTPLGDIVKRRDATRKGESVVGVSMNFAKAIKKAIMHHLRNAEAEGSRSFNGDGFVRAAYWLAHICDQSDVKAILKICTKSSSSYDVLNILEMIISRGITVPGKRVWDILESKCAESELQCERGHSNTDFSSIHIYIQILLMSDDPLLGVQKLRCLSPKCLATYQTRGTVSALGVCNCNQALEFLLELQSKPEILKFCYSEWLNALSRYADSRVREIFSSHAKHPKGSLFLNGRQDGSIYLAGALVNLLAVDEAFEADIKSLCASAVSNDERDLLASVLEKTSHERRALFSLVLLKDDSTLPIPVQIYRIVDDHFKKKIPISEYNSYYEESKDSNELREDLYSIAVNDPTRRQCAFELLAYIELIRIEKGRPTDEPRHPNLQPNDMVHRSWLQMDR